MTQEYNELMIMANAEKRKNKLLQEIKKDQSNAFGEDLQVDRG